MRNDPKKAAKIAMRELAARNPPLDDLRDEIRLNIPDMVLKLQADDINVSSMTEDEWRSMLVAQGLDEEDATELLEDIASWGVTDEV